MWQQNKISCWNFTEKGAKGKYFFKENQQKNEEKNNFWVKSALNVIKIKG